MNNKEIIEKNKQFFKKIASRYDKGIGGRILHKRTKKVILLTNIKNNSKILDIGCGTGTLLKELTKDKTLKLHGIDLSKEMLDIAKEKLGKKAKIKQGMTNKLKDYYPKNTFDYIFIDDTLHHLPEQEDVIKQCYALLKTKGKIIINDFSFGRMGNYLFHKIEPGNTGMKTKREYLQLLQRQKFTNMQQERIGIFSVCTRGTKK